jgi:hypothetical protein
MPEFVYKASERAGVATFEPRPFWETENFSRSGGATDPAKIPPGARVFHGVYAARGSFIPFYFAPSECPRFSIDPRANPPALPVLEQRLGPLPPNAKRLIVFREPDRATLAAHAYSVYALDPRLFTVLPTGEFLAEVPVQSARETRHENALTSIEAAGWAVRFVEDVATLRDLRDALRVAGVTRFSGQKL